MATKKIRREADGTVGSINDAQLRGGNPGSLQPSFSEKQIRQWLDDWYDGYEGKQFSRMYNKKVKRITATYSPLAVFSIAKFISSRAFKEGYEKRKKEETI